MTLLRKNKFRSFDKIQQVFFENQIISEDTDSIRKEAITSQFVQNFINKELLKVQKDGPAIFDKKRESLNSEVEKYITSIEA